MAIAIKHAFTSLKGDGTDATLVQPSQWNAAHNTSMATGNIIGRLSAGAGVFEEIPISAYMASLLGAADMTTLAGLLGILTTGDTKASLNPTPNNGWIAYQGAGTIGNAASSASVRANADTQNLFVMLYTQISDTYCAVSGGRSGNAVNDYNANKTLTMPWFSGRTIIGAGGGGLLTTRTLGAYFGEENHTITVSEMPSHYHSAGIYDPAHSHSYLSPNSAAGQTGGGAFNGTTGGNGNTTGSSVTGVRVNSSNGLDTTYSQGGGAAHNNMQPSIPLWIHVKL